MKKNSFTLLEVILAITVLTLAVGGSFVLISQTIASVSVVQSKLVASYLAQEGIETVKNIRDTNWLKGKDWDEGLGEETGEIYYEVDYDDFSLTECSSPCDYDHDYNLHFLKIPDQGFYNYDLGDPTIFKRKITISDKVDLDDPPDEEADKMKISVEVLWKEKGKMHSITSMEYLYNWTK